eukprot:TRINITY_DN5702_c0_g1_i1.p1 TRINITY_DN5702_c0_g1~~TRINITY_DN5702_c0_g1_i1.p1  ORF type:complete len:413 (-),score=128.69 TRINITY_DN5702_c0_g1_i1:34-1248(-)
MKVGKATPTAQRRRSAPPPSWLMAKHSCVVFVPVLLCTYAITSLLVSTTGAESPSRCILPSPGILAHRGTRFFHAENTLPAHRTAVQLGADVLELDVSLTADGHLVVFHDHLNVSSTTDSAPSPMAALPLDRVRRLDAGHWFSPDDGTSFPLRGAGVQVPTLDEFLTEFYDYPVFFNIEIKDTNDVAPRKLFDALEAFPHLEERVVVVASDCDTLNNFRSVSSHKYRTSNCENEVVTLLVVSLLRLGSLYYRLFPPEPDCWELPETSDQGLPLAFPSVVDTVHRVLQGKIFFFVVNEPAVMQRITTVGGDGFITDRVDLAYQLLHNETPRTAQLEFNRHQTLDMAELHQLTVRDWPCENFYCVVLDPLMKYTHPGVVLWGLLYLLVLLVVGTVDKIGVMHWTLQ